MSRYREDYYQIFRNLDYVCLQELYFAHFYSKSLPNKQAFICRQKEILSINNYFVLNFK